MCEVSVHCCYACEEVLMMPLSSILVVVCDAMKVSISTRCIGAGSSFLGNWLQSYLHGYPVVVSVEQRVMCLSGPSGYKRLLSLHGAGE